MVAEDGEVASHEIRLDDQFRVDAGLSIFLCYFLRLLLVLVSSEVFDHTPALEE